MKIRFAALAALSGSIWLSVNRLLTMYPDRLEIFQGFPHSRQLINISEVFFGVVLLLFFLLNYKRSRELRIKIGTISGIIASAWIVVNALFLFQPELFNYFSEILTPLGMLILTIIIRSLFILFFSLFLRIQLKLSLYLTSLLALIISIIHFFQALLMVIPPIMQFIRGHQLISYVLITEPFFYLSLSLFFLAFFLTQK